MFRVGGAEAGDFTLHLRRGVLEITDGVDPDASTQLSFTDKSALADYLAGTSLAALETNGSVTVTGNRDSAARFSAYIDEPPSSTNILVTLHTPAQDPASTSSSLS